MSHTRRVPIDNDELRQRIVGLMALGVREALDDAPFASQQASESLMALVQGLTEYNFDLSVGVALR
jgi:hypothetical protein